MKYVVFAENERDGQFKHYMTVQEAYRMCRLLFLSGHFEEYELKFFMMYGYSASEDYENTAMQAMDLEGFLMKCLRAYGVEPAIVEESARLDVDVWRYEPSTGEWVPDVQPDADIQ